MKIRLEEGDHNFIFHLVPILTREEKKKFLEKGEKYADYQCEKEIVIQTDWDYPGVASHFGFVPCPCGETDGTVDCEHKTASQMIANAYDFLREHLGMVIDDPGYFYHLEEA